MNIILSLQINHTDYIELLSANSLELADNLYTVWFVVRLTTAKEIFYLRTYTNGYELYDYIERIQICLNHLQVAKIRDDIDLGLLWNDYWEKYVAIELQKNNNDIVKWEYRDTLFLEYNSKEYINTSTFLYETYKNDIILQVSMAYPWLYKEPNVSDQYISYQDWLPQYKILYKTVISPEIAQKWVKQLSELYALLDANMPFGR